MKGKCRIRGLSKIKHQTNSWILESENQFWWGPSHPILRYIIFASRGNKTLGRQGNMLNQEVCEF